ncbi:Ankyrin repeat-containing protein [Artemisia annua]|uniref:Ankyrin repeat-containing protein n=1 Tax=Artemisia annua TaxID=35608 RepID=A0A2U1L9T3_ARTAN|nr:Ankyrin repeat-containing protein [Artemisia annua]
MEKLIEVSDSVVCMDFVLGMKCRTTIRLRSITTTSSPHKFLVNPPSGLIAPLAQSIIQIILKPQPKIPDSFPCSASDRFLIRTGRVGSVGHLNNGDCDTVRSMVKYQRTILTELSTCEAESVLRVATSLDNSVGMVSLLLEVGLKVVSATRSFDDLEESKWMDKGWTDKEGRSPLILAASKGFERCVKVLKSSGAKVDAKHDDGCTTLYRAAAKGDSWMVKVLVELGADHPSIVADQRDCSAIDVARDEGEKEIVEILERGKEVLNASRREDIMLLESLLEKDASVDFKDQYGLTAIHIAAIKGYKDVVILECIDAEGRTPLHMAVVGSSEDTVEVLINRSQANVCMRFWKVSPRACMLIDTWKISSSHLIQDSNPLGPMMC